MKPNRKKWIDSKKKIDNEFFTVERKAMHEKWGKDLALKVESYILNNKN